LPQAPATERLANRKIVLATALGILLVVAALGGWWFGVAQPLRETEHERQAAAVAEAARNEKDKAESEAAGRSAIEERERLEREKKTAAEAEERKERLAVAEINRVAAVEKADRARLEAANKRAVEFVAAENERLAAAETERLAAVEKEPLAAAPAAPTLLTQPPAVAETTAALQSSSPASTGDVAETSMAVEEAERQLTIAYTALRKTISEAAKQKLKREQIEWINRKDAIADPASRSKFIQERTSELKSGAGINVGPSNNDGDPGAASMTVQEAERQLTIAYTALRKTMTEAAKQELKREQIEWIRRKDAITDPASRSKFIQERTSELRRGAGR
jgi:uncharacterized protein YecT (DUF1311 family)